jgi:hypothetical protein
MNIIESGWRTTFVGKNGELTKIIGDRRGVGIERPCTKRKGDRDRVGREL